MATPRLAGPAARPWLALGAVLAAGIGGLHALTYGLSAWTLDERRDLRIASLDLQMPATAVQNQQGHGVQLFSGNATSTVYIVDFIYTRCNTVCSALGGEFAQLSRQGQACLCRSRPTACQVNLVLFRFHSTRAIRLAT